MATYLEIYSKYSDDELRQKVAVAIVVAAEVKLTGTPTADEASWAVRAIQNPLHEAQVVTALVLAANKTLSLAQIDAATDAAIQANVDSVVDGLVAGLAAQV